jgi:hypothetical protein
VQFFKRGEEPSLATGGGGLAARDVAKGAMFDPAFQGHIIYASAGGLQCRPLSVLAAGTGSPEVVCHVRWFQTKSYWKLYKVSFHPKKGK